MTSNIRRKADAHLIYYVWQAIRQSKTSDDNTAEFNKIVRELLNTCKLTERDASILLDNMVEDGFLEMVKPARKSDKLIYAIPDFDEIDLTLNNSSSTHDCYCYECHKPGENLINCADCYRVFHKDCARIDLNAPPFSLKEPVPEFIQNTFFQIYGYKYWEQSPNIESKEKSNDILSDIFSNENKEEKPTETVENGKSLQQNNVMNDISSEIIADFTDSIIQLPDITNDEFSLKSNAVSKSQENDVVYKLCTVCRLMKAGLYNLPPNHGIEEINYLLSFAFKRVRTWIPLDTFSSQESTSIVIPTSDLEHLGDVLFFKETTTEEVASKLFDNKYSNFTEFLCDLLDIHHCIGILRGTNIPEYEASKYLFMDSLREISEIKLCPDCYRHSNEKNVSFWFSKPCAVKHEIFFAKQTGYCYWPAKLVRITNNKYDVRFFGAKHSRALIDSHNVKPIETSLKLLKVKKTSSFTKAMKELEKYQELASANLQLFSFETERNNITIDGSEKKLKSIGKPGFSSTPKDITIEPSTGLDKIEQKADSTKSAITQIIKRPQRSATSIKTVTANNNEIILETPLTSRISKSSSSPSPSKKKSIPVAPTKRVNSRSKRSRPMSSSEESTIDDYINPKKTRNEAPHSSDSENNLNEVDIQKPVLRKPSSSENSDMAPDDKNTSVTSSTELKKQPTPDSPRIKGKVERSYYAVEKLRLELIEITSIEEVRQVAVESLKSEIDKWQSRMREILEKHEKEVNEIKKREWCAVCKKVARYHCCLCTAYCSQKCQEVHWNNGHKLVHKKNLESN